MIGGRQAIWLVARREIVTRGRERAFAISTVITLVIIAAIVLLPSLIGGGTDKAKTVAVGPDAAATVAAAKRVQKQFDVRILPRRAGTDAQARRMLDAGDADVALLGDGKRIAAAGGAPDGAITAVQAASRGRRALAALRRSGADPADAQRILAPPPLAVTKLDQDADARTGFAFVALIIMYGQLLIYGVMVASGVVEEKASRIVEILLATIRPRELLAGKVLGIGLLALGQLLLVGVVGLALASVSGQVDVGARELSALPVVLAWFVLGFGLYACAYAMGGALVSRQEDINSVTTPITMVVLASFFLGFQAVREPDGPLAQVLSIVPLSSPLIMPVRVIGGNVPAWEVILSVALSLAAIVVVIVLAGRMYGAAVLRTGGKLSLRTALRQAA